MPRLLILADYAPNVVARASNAQLDYTEMMQKLHSTVYDRSKYLLKHFGDLGYEAIELAPNAPLIQAAWARENNISLNKPFISHEKQRFGRLAINKITNTHVFGSLSPQLQSITLAQVKALRPDVILATNVTAFSPSVLREMRQYCRFFIGECGYPVPRVNWGLYDLILSCHPGFLANYCKQGAVGHFWPHAFEPAILGELGPIEKTRGLVFCGFVGGRFSIYVERWRIVSALSQHIPIEVYGAMRQVPKNLVPKPSVWGNEMYRMIGSAHISLNVHGDKNGNFSSNMRMFETTGIGTCMLTEATSNLDYFFAPDEEVVTFKSIDECVEKAKWLLEHPEECAKIGKAGQKRTLKDHTLQQRVQELDQIIRKKL